ncbi:MAG TPA: DUF6292 family protein [Pseudonocardiaceae bacterium]
MDNSDAFSRALRGYFAIVAAALGIGLESCTLDTDSPASAYLAVDQKAAAFPERDVAVLWDQRHGWSVAVETHSGEDLIVLAYLDTDTVVPPADLVAGFVEAICAGDTRRGRSDPPAIGNDADRRSLLVALSASNSPAAPLPGGAIPPTARNSTGVCGPGVRSGV